jgi:hypothetical protein
MTDGTLPFATSRGHAAPGDHLGRVYTPYPLARAIVARLAVHPRLGPPQLRRILEPSCGGGAFLRAVREVMPDAITTGIDIDPEAEGLGIADEHAVADWPTWAAAQPAQHWLLAVGNPPYHTIPKGDNPGVPWAVTIGHVNACIRAATVVALILPIVYRASSTFVDAVPEIAEVWPILPRPWDRVREVALYVWGTGGSMPAPLRAWR